MQDYAQIIAAGVEATPADYTVPNAQEIVPLAINAVFDGTNAVGDFVPTVVIVSDGGTAMARIPCETTVLAGNSAEVSWFPGPFSKPPATAAGTLADWARLTNFVGFNVPSGVLTAAPWQTLETSNTATFTTLPGNVAGDTQLFVNPNVPSVITLQWGVLWAGGTGFARWALATSSHAPFNAFSSPEGGSALPAGVIAGQNPHTAGVQVFGQLSSLGPISVTINCFQQSGVNQSATAYLDATVIPCNVTDTIVY